MNKETGNNLFWSETGFVESSAKYTVYQIINKREKRLFKISISNINWKGKDLSRNINPLQNSMFRESTRKIQFNFSIISDYFCTVKKKT